MKNNTKGTTKRNKRTPITLLNPLITIFSAINTGMLMTIKLIYITSQQIGMVGIMLGNIGAGVFFSSTSLMSSLYSFFNYFREKSLYEKFNYEKTLEAKRKDNHRIQGICLNILCDILFLTSAAVSIALFSNPVAFFATAPLVTLGCVVMVGNITNSTYRQVKDFKNHLSQFSKEEQKRLYTEMKKEINSSYLYKIMAKTLPETLVLAKLHANAENKERRKEVQHLEEMLRECNRKPTDSDIADKNSKTTKMRKEEHIKRKSSNSEVPTHLSLGKNLIEEREKGSNTPRSL
ncbi:MAG: hypothetical protein LKM43_05305 [Wolbachia endosymbiont of Penenirmus auritus]|nr:hypothetical protein [Wolbachia endosymbiont of Penenirmus auritus]